MVGGALVVGVGGADQRLPEPRQHEDRAAAARGHDRAGAHRQRRALDQQVRPARGADHRHLGLVVQLGGPQPVGPDAGRVDDVGGADLELLAALGVAQARADRAAAVLEQLDGLEPVREDRPEALGLGQHGQHEPDVVGLAVVEQVAARRLRCASAGSSSLTSARRSPGGAPGSSRAPRARRRRAASAAAGRRPSRRRRSGRGRRAGPAARRRTPGPRRRSGRTRCGARLTLIWRSSSASRTRPRSKFCR